MDKKSKKLKTPSIREKFVTLLLNKDFRACADFIKQNPKDTLWYFNLIRETYKLSLFWVIAMSAMLRASNPKVKDGFISTILIERLPNQEVGGYVFRILISNEASKENIERIYTKIYNDYRNRGVEENGPSKIDLEEFVDPISQQVYYKLTIYPRSGKRTVMRYYNIIMDRYKKSGIYEKWQEKKDTIKQLQAVLLKELGKSHLDVGIELGEEPYNITTLVKRGKAKLLRLKGGPRNDL